MLLYWGTLTTNASSNIAAIRFAYPVQVHSLRVFPTGASPFTLDSDIIAETEPPSFFLDIYFNAQPVLTPSGAIKPRPSNALVCTSLSYVGGQRDFPIDWEPGSATRLMIIQGGFESATVAVYGNAFNDLSHEHDSCEEINIMVDSDSLPTSPGLDPAHSLDPTRLARHLLSSTSCPASLETVIRLVFCIKPRKEDWQDASFPKYLDLDAVPSSIEETIEKLSFPIPENSTVEVILRFSSSIRGILESADGIDGSWRSTIVALLCCQTPSVMSNVLKSPNFSDLLALDLSPETLSTLYHAAIQPDLASILNETFLSEMWRRGDRENPDFYNLATLLQAQVRQCVEFDDLLRAKSGDIDSAVSWMHKVASSEQSLGIWLLSLVEQPQRVMLHSEYPVTAAQIRSLSRRWLLLPERSDCTSQGYDIDSFAAFLRGYIGVASILAVFAWADSIADENCVTRTLGILRVWQSNEDYVGIVNHLLSLPQFTVRLERLVERNGIPSQAVIFAEEILIAMLDHPEALLNEDVSYTVRTLPIFNLTIAEDKRATAIELAELAEGSIEQPIEVISAKTNANNRRSSMASLLLSLIILRNKLCDQQDAGLFLVDSAWRTVAQGALYPLTKAMDAVNEALCQVAYDVPVLSMETLCQGYVLKASRLAVELIQSTVHLNFPTAADIPLVTRRLLTCFCALRTWQDFEEKFDFELSELHKSAIQACTTTFQVICGIRSGVIESCSQWTAAVKAILQETTVALHPIRDPTKHLSHVVFLLLQLLPTGNDQLTPETNGQWIFSCLIPVLPTLTALFKCLRLKDKVEVSRRLASLENGSIGLMEWFVNAELQFISDMTDCVSSGMPGDIAQFILEQQIDESFHFLLDICHGQNITFMYTESDQNLPMLTECLHKLCSAGVSSPSAGRLVARLRPHYIKSENELPFLSVRVLLQAALKDLSLLPPTTVHLKDAPSTEVCEKAIAQDVEKVFRKLSTQPPGLFYSSEQSQAIIDLAQWFSGRCHSLPTIEEKSFKGLLENCKREANHSDLDLDMLLDGITFFNGGILAVDVEPILDGRAALLEISQLVVSTPIVPSTPRMSSVGLAHEAAVIATISPNSSILRSPFTSLAKTYTGDSFRQLRQESYRQNTSRLPSLHVDAFEAGASSPTPSHLTHPLSSPPLLTSSGIQTVQALQQQDAQVHTPDYGIVHPISSMK